MQKKTREGVVAFLYFVSWPLQYPEKDGFLLKKLSIQNFSLQEKSENVFSYFLFSFLKGEMACQNMRLSHEYLVKSRICFKISSPFPIFFLLFFQTYHTLFLPFMKIKSIFIVIEYFL